MKGDELAKHVIGGLTIEESGIDLTKFRKFSLGAAAADDPSYFILPPLPNTLFTARFLMLDVRRSVHQPDVLAGAPAGGIQRRRYLPVPPVVRERRFRVLVPAPGRRRALQRGGLRSLLTRGRRRTTHRQRNSPHRDERADASADDRTGRQRSVRERRCRARDRGRNDEGPRPHAPGHSVHPSRSGTRQRPTRRSSKTSEPSVSVPGMPRDDST